MTLSPAPAATEIAQAWEARQRAAGMRDAALAGITRAYGDAVMVMLRDEGGRLHRFRLSGADARVLASEIASYGADPECACQSERSSGRPSVAGSVPQAGQNVVPPVNSSSAEAGDA